METAVLTLLVAVCGILTVTLLGCLRMLADVRLHLQLGGERPQQVAGEDYVSFGRPLPEQLRTWLPWLGEDGLVLFLSPSCPQCWELASLLPKLRIQNVAVGVVGDQEEMLEQAPSSFVVLPSKVAGELAELYRFEAMPFGIHQRDGIVVGSIHSSALVSIDEIERFWTFSGARLVEVAA